MALRPCSRGGTLAGRWRIKCHSLYVSEAEKRLESAITPWRIAMRAPYGLNILDNCLTCPVRGEHLFCNLSPQAGQRLNEIKSTAVYPKGAMLFIEGQQPRGVFVLCVGKVKLSTSSREG